MHLVELKCEGFRSLSEIDFSPGPALNFVRGDNAQGKTSLLEALLFLATSKSHRTNNEGELVQHGAEGFRVSADVQRHDRLVKLEAVWWQGVKRFKINGVAQSRVSEILGKVHVVFFSPEDVDLVRGAASARRRFLDMELSQMEPPYLHALQQYKQVQRQRNEVLRSPHAAPSLLAPWDEQLCRYGAILMERRAEFVERLARQAAVAYEQIAGRETFSIAYQPDVKNGASFPDVLAAARESDRRQGLTTRGPHRDEVTITVTGTSGRHFASQGQQRTAALALKLGELELVRESVGEYPILMLDDVFSELDRHRAQRLIEAIPENTQCLITTTEPAHDEHSRHLACESFTIRGGRLAPEGVV